MTSDSHQLALLNVPIFTPLVCSMDGELGWGRLCSIDLVMGILGGKISHPGERRKNENRRKSNADYQPSPPCIGQLLPCIQKLYNYLAITYL